ncbi:MAG TPA: hypothetical protein VHB79_34605 [Polyangiaceae bacterium]|nr:hypothetical protein [Polyangiaceae bacterium]
MRKSSCIGLFLLVGCGASEVQSQHLKDGSWAFQCELGMDECVRRVQDRCPNQRYRILEGTSETRLRDAPPFERAYHTSRLHLVCNDGGADVLLSVGTGKDEPSPEPKAYAKPTPKLCSAGQTRECIGAGACKGGQACLPDGSGFGACDCGPAAVPTPATPGSAPGEAVTSPAGAPASSTPPPSAAPAPSSTPAAPTSK